MRLDRLQASVARLDQSLDEEQNTARILVQVWRNEHHDTGETRFKLARRVHEGDPEAVAEMKEELIAETVHVRARAVEWVETLPELDQDRWRKIFGL